MTCWSSSDVQLRTLRLWRHAACNSDSSKTDCCSQLVCRRLNCWLMLEDIDQSYPPQLGILVHLSAINAGHGHKALVTLRWARGLSVRREALVNALQHQANSAFLQILAAYNEGSIHKRQWQRRTHVEGRCLAVKLCSQAKYAQLAHCCSSGLSIDTT